ncbi:glycoside hydrolase family 65 protein [Puniceicoccales bacterium CK1056]|uniref:Glycoside hydrolase family 65 protein n=1 Tax=Oceanipulchritudo coccoides TaxID=2706888 RepID=A0A6B2M3W1_9BACT|nr:glycosyl hydrolase family 65 protein [Oceanipulchritudo coccoides]NDV62794.1 glycoside hydrolase family 65 protein [Oceanipulchritudo coccoides]
MNTSEERSAGADDWTVAVNGWDPEKVTHHGNLFLLGNGCMGYRGTLEEFGPDEKVGILIPGLYDRVGDAWREPVNAPNALFTRIAINGKWLNPLDIKPDAHQQSLDLRTATHRRLTRFTVDGVRVLLSAERFLSADKVNLMAMQFVIEIQGQAEVTVETGIDQRIWDLNGPHLEGFSASQVDGTLLLESSTHEKGEPVAVAERALWQSKVPVGSETVDGSMRRWQFSADGSVSLALEKVATVHTSLDQHGVTDIDELACRELAVASEAGYKKLHAAHREVWEQRWNRADITIDGDREGQNALRYSIYQLLSAAPFHSEHLSIPARALSGQVYKGAIFWDTEIFMLPFFLATFPEVARNLVRYRIHTLDGAKEKAREYGHVGAFYPWEGQEGGFDACTLFNVTDVFTHRPMRTYFRDKQIHISGDVAWAVWRYVQVTGDHVLLWSGGFEVMLECARFFLSWAYRTSDDKHFVLLDVTGPDEYHERVNNNAYTNYLVRHCVRAMLEAARIMAESDPEKFSELASALGFNDAERDCLQDFADRLHLPQPNPRNGIIEQFDGYFQLEDCSLDQLKGRIIDPNEYLGGGSGLATTTCILKQADTVLATFLFDDIFSPAQKEANWNFYEPRTEHGSSLSACVYSLVATEIGKPDFAYEYFLKTATIDLHGNSKQHVGTLYIGGTHPAANGGAWMVAVLGFAGLNLLPDQVRFRPRLPSQWNGLCFSFCWQGLLASVSIDNDVIEVHADPTNSSPIPCAFDGTLQHCQPGQVLSLPFV